MDSFGVVLLIVVLLGFYLMIAVTTLDLFFGWTVVLTVARAAWAVTDFIAAQRRSVTPAQSPD